MNVQIEETGKLSRRLRFVIPFAEIGKEMESRLKRLAASSRLDGFRPGKAPMKIIRGRYQEKVFNEVAAEKMEHSCRRAVDEHQLDAVHRHIVVKELALGHDLRFTVNLELFPQFDPLTLDGEEIEEYRVTVGQADVDNVVERMRRSHADWRPVDRPAQKGDRVQTSFVNRGDAHVFFINPGDRVSYLLGDESASEEITHHLHGVRAGEVVTLPLTPLDQESALKNEEKRPCRMRVESVEQMLLPPLNDDFYKKFLGAQNIDEKSAQLLLRAGMEHKAESLSKKHVHHALRQRLLKKNSLFDMPQGLVDQESGGLVAALKKQLSMDDQEAERLLEDGGIRKRAEQNVRWLLLSRRLVERHQLTVGREQVDKALDRLASRHENPQAALNYFRRDERTLKDVYAELLEEQVFDLVLSGMKRTPTDCTFTEFMEKPAIAYLNVRG